MLGTAIPSTISAFVFLLLRAVTCCYVSCLVTDAQHERRYFSGFALAPSHNGGAQTELPARHPFVRPVEYSRM